MKPAGLWYSALTVTAAVVLLSCGESTPTGPPPQWSVSRLASGHASRHAVKTVAQQNGLLHCAPLPPDSVTQTIGPQGGTIEVGLHSLKIPPHALRERVSITALAPSDTVNLVRFRPEGLSFERPAELTMSYKNCATPGSKQEIRIAYVNDSLAIIEYLEMTDASGSRQVSGLLEHFSGYAVAW